MRLSMSSLAGTARTLVAVGTVRLVSMLVTTRAAGPRRRTLVVCGRPLRGRPSRGSARGGGAGAAAFAAAGLRGGGGAGRRAERVVVAGGLSRRAGQRRAFGGGGGGRGGLSAAGGGLVGGGLRGGRGGGAARRALVGGGLRGGGRRAARRAGPRCRAAVARRAAGRRPAAPSATGGWSQKNSRHSGETLAGSLRKDSCSSCTSHSLGPKPVIGSSAGVCCGTACVAFFRSWCGGSVRRGEPRPRLRSRRGAAWSARRALRGPRPRPGARAGRPTTAAAGPR